MNTTEIREHPPIGTFTVHTDFGVYLLSSEFSHDTALRVTGDFRDDAELVSFAGTIAMRLNRYEELLDEVERLRDDRDLEKRWRKDADDYREEFIEENGKLKSLLTDWQEFAKDVGAGDPCGQDWLDGLRGRTKRVLEQKHHMTSSEQSVMQDALFASAEEQEQ